MSEAVWAEVARRSDAHGYMQGVERTVERVRATGEIFTPTSLVIEMIRRMPIEAFRPGQKVLDPACGDGQFLVAAKWVKVLFFGMTEEEALKDIYGVDIMRDNVDLCKRRLGGGTIVMGNSLLPDVPLDGQTEEESRLMSELFGSGRPDEDDETALAA